ncbi:MAG: RNA methyltransferase [Leptospiraceae bacterium]|nr:RNA methyltransferase [Leptospiraceae bacterium]MDW8307611.1 RNA methyltransferase [Leptospiraceae bacterium]
MNHIITSEKNPFFREIKHLSKSRYIRKRGKFLAGGEKILSELCRHEVHHFLLAWISCPGHEHQLPGKNIPVYFFSKDLFRQIDFFGTGPPLALLKVPPLPFFTGKLGEGISLFLPFQDPGNIGSSLRSASAFSVSEVILLKESAYPFLPRSVRSAGSALFQIKLSEGPSLQELLSAPPPHLYLLDIKGEDIRNFNPPPSLGLVAGLEGKGIPFPTNLPRIRIPIHPRQNSLNAAVAIAIALFVLQTKWQLIQPAGEKADAPSLHAVLKNKAKFD